MCSELTVAMPYQIKNDSLVIVADNSADALRLYDELERTSSGGVVIRDMDGTEVAPNVLRSSIASEQRPPKRGTMKQILDAIRKADAQE